MEVFYQIFQPIGSSGLFANNLLDFLLFNISIIAATIKLAFFITKVC